MALDNAFYHTIPHNWSHTLASPTTKETYYTPQGLACRQPYLPGTRQASSPTRRKEPGNPGDPRSRSYTGNIFVKNHGYTNSVRKRRKKCIEAIKPLPTFKAKNGEFV